MNATSGTVLAEESHNSILWASLLAAGVVGGIFMLNRAQPLHVKVILGGAELLVFLSTLLALSGFRYLFTDAGVEVRTLGFRLRFIAVEDIEAYHLSKWSIAGGYGIRYRPGRTAYVWGNKGVRIKTSAGEVFLGSNRPEKIIQDLGLIKPFLS